MDALVLIAALLTAGEIAEQERPFAWLPPLEVCQQQWEAHYAAWCWAQRQYELAPDFRRGEAARLRACCSWYNHWWECAVYARQGRMWRYRLEDRLCWLAECRAMLGEPDWWRQQWPCLPLHRLPQPLEQDQPHADD